MKFLVVDDNINDANLAVRALSREFPDALYTVTTTEKDFESALNQDGYSLVLTDYYIGWTDGFNVFKNIKSRWPDMPVIMVTETGSEEIAVQAMKFGLSDYVLKRHLDLLPAAVKENLKKVKVEHERAEALLKLKASEERNRIVSELTSDFVFVSRVSANGDFSLEWMTGAFTRETGYSPRDFEELGWEKIVHPEDLPEYLAAREQLLLGKTTNLDFRIVTKTGEVRWARSYNQPIIDDAGKVVKVFGALQDITDEKEAEETIISKDKAIRQAYIDVFSAVTGGRLVISTVEEIEAVSGDRIGDVLKVSTFDAIVRTRKRVEKILNERWPNFYTFGFLVSLSEAITNAVKHAGGAELKLFLDGGTIQARVEDSGPGINFKLLPRAALEAGFSTKQSLGLGFSIMLQECDRVFLSTGSGGTTLMLEKSVASEKPEAGAEISSSVFKQRPG